MSSSGLHITIKETIDKLGNDIIISPQFVNILSDYSAFSDFPACKVIMRDLLKSGDLQKIYDIYKQEGKSCTTEMDKLKKVVQKKGKFKRPLVAYIFDCFLYAFGVLNDVKTPEINAYDAFANNGSILDTLNDQLEDLKNEYRDLLYKAIVLPKDRLHDPAGYYTTQSMNDLYLIEAKYKVIAVALGLKEIDWCRHQLNDQLKKYAAQKRLACETEITRLKKSFCTIINKAKPNTEISLAKPSDLDIQSNAEIAKLEIDIRRMYEEAGIIYDDWCSKQKQEKIDAFLRDYTTWCKKRLTSLKDAYLKRLEKAKSNTDPQKEKPSDLDNQSIVELSKIEKEIKLNYREIGIEYDDWCSTKRYQRLGEFRRVYFATREQRLKELKKEYLDCLNLSQRDSLGDFVSPKSVDPESEKKLSRIQTLIKSCYIDLEKQYDNWCEIEFGKKVKKFQSDFVIKCGSLLNKLKADYASRLENEALITHKGIISKSAEFNEAILQSLHPLEEDIKKTYHNANRAYDNFCENTQSEILKRHYVSPEKRRNQILARIVAPLVIAAFPLGWGAQYMMLKGDIEKFDQQMTQANGFVDQGNLSSALLTYDAARDGYDHEFLGKKTEAEYKIEELVYQICDEADELITQNRYTAADAKLKEVPEQVVSDNKNLKERIAYSRTKLDEAVSNVITQLLNNISSHSGKLDAEGKKMLEEALLISPDDYWLNFIKNKEI